MAARGRFSFKGSGYVRGDIFDRIQLIQIDLTVMFHDRDHLRLNRVAAEGAPEFTETDLFRTPANSGFDPTQPWRLQLLVSRDVAATEKVFTTFHLGWQPSTQFLRTVSAPKMATCCRLLDLSMMSSLTTPTTISAFMPWAQDGKAEMTSFSRRRFLALSAALPFGSRAAAAVPITRYRETALGAAASLMLAHPEADQIAAGVWAEIDRLENIFSLYRPESSLSQLNAAGRLGSPPFELLECLSLAGAVHAATGGTFDPTVQPLWAEYAEAVSEVRALSPSAVLSRVEWAEVEFSAGAVTLDRPGMALTLNGIAQGFIADRLAALLTAEGLTKILTDTGELSGLGTDPRGGDWSVRVVDGRQVPLRDRALATSAPLGTVFDQAGKVGHILDARTGLPAAAGWKQISVTAPSAAIADACSTAFCLMGPEAIEGTLDRLRDVRVVHAS